jgi:catechol 2,3-dioxygenase-like lactoylglutathione lyase family enzyme
MPDPTPIARALAHVSIATPDAEATAREYAALLGATIRSRETLDDRGLHVVFLDCAGVPIELIQPVDPDSPTNTVAKFLKTRGPGLHHLRGSSTRAACAGQGKGGERTPSRRNAEERRRRLPGCVPPSLRRVRRAHRVRRRRPRRAP